MIINRVITAYRVEESWVIKEEPGIQTIFVLDEDEAKRKLAELVQTESTEGCILEWSKDPQFETESGELYYECWLRDEYCENRYITPGHFLFSSVI